MSDLLRYLDGDNERDYDDEVDDELQLYMYDPTRQQTYSEEKDKEPQQSQQKPKTKHKKQKKNFKGDFTIVYIKDEEVPKPPVKQQTQDIQKVSFTVNTRHCFKMNWSVIKPSTKSAISLRRMGMASFVSKDKLYLQGGRDNKYVYATFCSYNFEENTWTVLPDGPRMSDHVIFPLGKGIIAYNGANEYYMFIDNMWLAVKRLYSDDKPEHVTAPSICHVIDQVLVFGGKTHNSVTNQLISWRVGASHEKKRSIVNPEKYAFVPEARSEHAVTSVGERMYIFGGIGAKGKLLNDLCYYTTTTSKWTLIDVTTPPPPLYASSLTVDTARHLFLYGGINADKKVSNVLYRFDPETSEWSINQVQSKEGSQQPLAYHCANAIVNSIMMIGGTTNYETREIQSSGLILHNVIDPGSEISHYMDEVFKSEKVCDISLRVVTDDGLDHEYIKVHKCMLAVRCPNLFTDEVIAGAQDSISGLPSLDTLVNYHASPVRAFMRYIYTGSLELDGKAFIDELVDLARITDEEHYQHVQKICYEKYLLTLETGGAILNRLQSDMNKLYQACETSLRHDLSIENMHPTHADVRIIILDEQTEQVTTVIEAHKVVLCRSSYIDHTFRSGMEETITNTIKFNDLSEQGLMTVLKFMYLNEITVTPENCIEVLIASLLFRFNDLATYCRTMVTDHLSVDNVVTVINIVDLYQDTAMKRACITFAAKNYDEVSKTQDWINVSEEVRNETETRYTHSAKKQEQKMQRELQKSKKWKVS
jgi:hypothetical protein